MLSRLFGYSNCKADGCKNPSTGKSPYCYYHKCSDGRCNYKKADNSILCDFCLPLKCSVANCIGTIEKDSSLCISHRCYHSSCKNPAFGNYFNKTERVYNLCGVHKDKFCNDCNKPINETIPTDIFRCIDCIKLNTYSDFNLELHYLVRNLSHDGYCSDSGEFEETNDSHIVIYQLPKALKATHIFRGNGTLNESGLNLARKLFPKDPEGGGSGYCSNPNGESCGTYYELTWGKVIAPEELVSITRDDL